jgi:hypothetical protein
MQVRGYKTTPTVLPDTEISFAYPEQTNNLSISTREVIQVINIFWKVNIKRLFDTEYGHTILIS